jgi:hypothetical protein
VDLFVYSLNHFKSCLQVIYLQHLLPSKLHSQFLDSFHTTSIMAEATPGDRKSELEGLATQRGQEQAWDKALEAANLYYMSGDAERCLQKCRENLKCVSLGERWIIGNLLLALDAKDVWDGEAQQFYYAAGGAIKVHAQKVKSWTAAALQDLADLQGVYEKFSEQRRLEGADVLPSGPPRPRPADKGSEEPTGDIPPRRSRRSLSATRNHRLASSGTKAYLRWITLADKVDIGTISSIPEEEEPAEDAPGKL